MTHEAHTLYKWVMIATLSTYFGNDVPYTSCLWIKFTILTSYVIIYLGNDCYGQYIDFW